MRSARTTNDDLTARARIRDSAIVYFGRHGFRSATVRAIAADAGVSPALVIHHFGSKDALREACDRYVTDSIDDLTSHASAHLQPGDLLDLMSRTPQLTPLVPYLTMAITEGGEFAERLWERLVQDTEAYLRAAVAGGVVRPTGDERARAEMLTIYKVGMYTLARYVIPPATGNGNVTDVDIMAIAQRFTVPSLEMFTYGMFTNSDYLDAFIQYQQTHGAGNPPGTPGPPGPPGPPIGPSNDNARSFATKPLSPA